MTYLFISAHPDDVEIACGCTIAKMVKNGHCVKVVILTHSNDTRELETRKALSVLGVRYESITLYNEPDGRINADLRLVSLIEREIVMCSPDMVITHFERDTHQDHRNVSMAVKSACRKGIPLCFFDSYSSEDFEPNVFVTADDECVKKKEMAIMEHRSQLGANNGILVTSNAKGLYYGNKCNCQYAEGFCLKKVIV